jgi:hypothetical protein
LAAGLGEAAPRSEISALRDCRPPARVIPPQALHPNFKPDFKNRRKDRIRSRESIARFASKFALARAGSIVKASRKINYVVGKSARILRVKALACRELPKLCEFP